MSSHTAMSGVQVYNVKVVPPHERGALQSPSRTAISGVQVSTSKTYRYVRGAVLQSALPFYRTLQRNNGKQA